MHFSTLRSAKKPVEGTAHWMSPEQMSFGTPNRMTDVYSFGMTMYEVWSGLARGNLHCDLTAMKIFTGLPPFCNVLDVFLLPLVVDRGQRPPDGAVRDRGLDACLPSEPSEPGEGGLPWQPAPCEGDGQQRAVGARLSSGSGGRAERRRGRADDGA